MEIQIPVAKPYIDDLDRRGVDEVLRSGILALGPKLRQFEQDFAKYLGVKYACAVSSGTAGLHIAVKTMGLKNGSGIITSPFSFIASSNCLLYENLKPVFVDIEEKTFNIDPTKIEKAINKNIKAILVVHIFGQSADMDPIIKLSKKYKLKIIEDACESVGSTYRGLKTGTLGDVSVFAFYPNKQMTTGEGGMLTTNNRNVHELALSLRNQGRSIKNDWLSHERLGYNYRMDEMSASLGITQIGKLDWMIGERNKIANLYNKYLSELDGVVLPQVAKSNSQSWFVYVIRITKGKRDEVLNYLLKKGVQTKAYLPTIHLQPFMKREFGYKKGDFPVAEKVSSETLALPFYIGLKEKDIKYICDTLRDIL